jgi:hypothetical protein
MAQNKITNFKGGDITQYIIFERLDVVGHKEFFLTWRSLLWQSHPMVYNCGCGVVGRALYHHCLMK